MCIYEYLCKTSDSSTSLCFTKAFTIRAHNYRNVLQDRGKGGRGSGPRNNARADHPDCKEYYAVLEATGTNPSTDAVTSSVFGSPRVREQRIRQVEKDAHFD